jgi:hypothetical protein
MFVLPSISKLYLLNLNAGTEYLEDFEELKSLLLDPSLIRMSTGNFAEENELGEGGFGKVYKVR